MDHIQRYVPVTSSGNTHFLLFGGDQLFRERAYNAKLNSGDPLKKIQQDRRLACPIHILADTADTMCNLILRST